MLDVEREMEQTETNLTSTNTKDAGYYSIVCIFLSTAIQSCFGFARNAPPVLKLIIAALCWLACFFAVRNNQTWRLYPQYVKVLFSVLFLDVFGAFVHAMWSGMVAEGEKYVVLMTSMATTLNVVSVLFVFVITQYSHLREILRGTILLFILNIFLLIFNFRVSTG